ncbi:hypothetical protein B0H14DRAFT_2617364 [Mycena olivaceomarginata]|nr:hypothetical protein B0H14DRAFT_2617364 [Mycena olivaceomarginata]
MPKTKLAELFCTSRVTEDSGIVPRVLSEKRDITFGKTASSRAMPKDVVGRLSAMIIYVQVQVKLNPLHTFRATTSAAANPARAPTDNVGRGKRGVCAKFAAMGTRRLGEGTLRGKEVLRQFCTRVKLLEAELLEVVEDLTNSSSGLSRFGTVVKARTIRALMLLRNQLRLKRKGLEGPTPGHAGGWQPFGLNLNRPVAEVAMGTPERVQVEMCRCGGGDAREDGAPGGCVAPGRSETQGDTIRVAESMMRVVRCKGPAGKGGGGVGISFDPLGMSHRTIQFKTLGRSGSIGAAIGDGEGSTSPLHDAVEQATNVRCPGAQLPFIFKREEHKSLPPGREGQ